MPVQMILSSRVPVKVWTDRIEGEVIRQLQNTASLPFVFRHVAAMPDVHLGKGATVGSVVATRGALVPAAVGVDIGCGMSARKTSIASDRLDAGARKALRHSIEREIPVGHAQNRKPLAAAAEWMRGNPPPATVSGSLADRARHQLGTLGGGNHFIEVCADAGDGNLWALLHSGSRNVGKTVAENHISRAKKAVQREGAELADPDLAYLLRGSPEFDAYRRDLEWCQAYARQNRVIMMERLLRQIAYALGFEGDVDDLGIELAVDCHHNYVADEVHFGERVLVTRKGAIRAGRGELGIIPGSMGTGTYIVRGLGNPESFESAPHGAGRAMSRGEARRMFTCEDLVRQTQGVECRKDARIVDEIPSAYKPIEEVMEKASDLVEPIARLKPLVCVKG